MIKKYYSLRFEHDDAHNRKGVKKINADNPLSIGQTESCDIRIDNPCQYEDTVLAVIEKRPDGKGWKIIRISPFREHEVRVNGTPVNYVHFLSNGDRIAFEGQRQELVFNVREDDQYASNDIVTIPQKRGYRLFLLLKAILTILLSFIVLQYLYNKLWIDNMIERAKQSVFQIIVDSVQLTVTRNDTTWVLCTDTHIEDNVGTAFLSSEGDLITARHCIEPWLSFSEGKLNDISTGDVKNYVKMALEAVTCNIVAESQDDDTRWNTVSYCSIKKPDGDTVLLSISSNKFIMDKSRDNVVQYGNFTQQYFWRSISVRPRRIDMMLGDIAYLPNANDSLHCNKNLFHIATKEEMRSICQKSNRNIIVLGYGAQYDVKSKDVDVEQSRLKGSLNDSDFSEEGFPNIVISLDGTIVHGYSGGPVVTRTGFFEFRVIGIVSVEDNHNNGRFYSVPVTEIERMKSKQK